MVRTEPLVAELNPPLDAFWGPRLDAWAPAATVLVEEESATSVIVEEPLELPVEEQEATVEQIVEQQAEEDSFDYRKETLSRPV